MPRRLILLSALAVGVQVSACASTLSPPPSQVAVVEPTAQPTGRAPESSRGQTQPSRAAAVGSIPSIKLRLTYAERLLVPRGSDIDLMVRDANGSQVYAIKTSTKRDAPPYVLEIPIKSQLAYPLKVEAHLTSRVGHRFSKNTEITENDASASNAVEIRLHKD